MMDENKLDEINRQYSRKGMIAPATQAHIPEMIRLSRLGLQADLYKSRLHYVLQFFEDHLDEIECRGVDDDCDHCIIEAMVKDMEEEKK